MLLQSKIQNPRSKIFISDVWLVLALTAVGGFLRFLFLDRPPIWGDEAMTFMRVCGTYQQMLDALQDWGFAPLHYELYWWIGQQTTLTPFMMRLVPAIAGTLMVPAMYWLGRELVDRRVGLVAALLAATSAYLLNYSRDAKMYMHFWMLCTVNFAALLWWLRARSGVAWWSWVASGVAMLGFNMLGVFVLGIELVAVVLARDARWRSVGQTFGTVAWAPVMIWRAPYTRWFAGFRWPPLVLFLIGVFIMLIGPYGYYKHFNRYVDRVERRGLAGGGLGWVEGYNRGRDAIDLLAYTATAHLYSWEWPRYNEKLKIDDAKEIAPRAVFWLKTAGITIGCLLLVGLFPWPRRWTGFRPQDVAQRTWPWPLALAIVLIWLVVPAYAVYCASVRDHLSPLEVLASLVLHEVPRVNFPSVYDVSWFGGEGFLARLSQAWHAFMALLTRENLRAPGNTLQWMLLVLGFGGAVAALVYCGNTWRQRLFKLSVLLAITLALYVCCFVVYAFYVQKYRGGSVWMPRYLGFIWPAVALAVAVLLLRLPTRPLRWGAIVLLVGVNLAQYSARVFAGSEVPTPMMAEDLIDSQPTDATVRMYYNVRVVPSGAPGTGYLWSVPGGYYLSVLSNTPTTPDEMIQTFGGRGQFVSKWKRWNVTLLPLPQYIVNDVKKTPRLRRLITWQNFTPRQTVSEDDPVAQRLGEQWRRADEQIFYVRDHWTWRNQMTLRRRVYERGESPPTTAPSTAPTPAP